MNVDPFIMNVVTVSKTVLSCASDVVTDFTEVKKKLSLLFLM